MTTISTGATDFVPVDLDGSTWENLQPLYQALLDRDVSSAQELEELILDRSELDAAAREAMASLYIAMTCDTEDQEVKQAFLDYVEKVEPELKRVGFELDTKIVRCPFRGGLDQDRYGVLLRDLTADVDLFREENVPLQTEDTKLGQQYAEICGAMLVNFRGTEKTLPQMGPHMEETDRATREEAWRLVAARRHQDHEAFSEIFDSMLVLRQQIAEHAGFDNYRDYMFKAKHRFDYGPAECEAFHRGAEEVCVPLHRELNRQRAETLGLDPLRPWDLAVDPKGRPPLRPFESADELVRKSSTLFHRLDPRLGTMFETLRDGTSLDLESRKGKAPGGYQQTLDRVRKPFIFMNAAGMDGDLGTMIHESGHAFHAILSKDDPLLHYRHAPIEFCEVASMSMELMAHPYLGEFYDEAEAARAKRMHLESMMRLLPWVATIDAFQHWLYTHPGHSRDERTDVWLDLDRRFGSLVSWDGIEQHRAVSWQRQLHVFEVPFYYIEYGIAQLGALDLWLQSRESESKAIANYERAMKLGGSRPLPELFAAAELSFDFGPQTMSRLIAAVQEELAKLPI